MIRVQGPRVIAAILLVALISTKIATAQDAVKSQSYTWKNVTVGAGGFIPGIVFSRVEKGLAYIRSDMGGFYRWDDKQQTWIPLNDAMSESSYHGGESIAPDPVDPNVVYAAAGMYRSDPSAMLRSRDRGNTWQVFPVSFKMGGNEDGRGMGERLAVDPNSTNVLYFGSRHNGLMRSDNFAQTWTPVASFPVKGLGQPARGSNAPRGEAGGGLSFVVFDPHSGKSGTPTKTIFVGSTDPGPSHLFRSDDAGATWTAVTGGPEAAMLPLKAEIDDQGLLFITYSNNVGPNGATAGAVFVFDTHNSQGRGQWANITPPPAGARGGFCGISLDRQHPGTLAVSTMDRWNPGDTVFRTTDNGKTWNDIAQKSDRDVSATPFLYWGTNKVRLGWWLCALAIDPFDSDHAVYATGATVYVTHNFSDVNRDQPTHWAPWVKGIEQTAIITLCSPAAGPPLLSGFGDIVGFVHNDLDKSPPQGFYQPTLGNTVMIDYAQLQPNIFVRSGDAQQNANDAAFSDDSGQSWQLLSAPQTANPSSGQTAAQAPGAGRRGRRRRQMAPAIAVSADGGTFILTTDKAMLTADRGKSWTPVAGLPAGVRPIADRMNAKHFYAIDFGTGELFSSMDGGLNFTPQATQGLPANTREDQPNGSGASWPLQASTGKEGDLWYFGHAGLFHSLDGGKTFSQTQSDVHVDALSFGKPPAGHDEPALFAIGSQGPLKAIWRSDDSGRSWIRLTDDQHEWGRRFRCIAGDPRIFGRVYVGTDGRAVFYGDVMK